MKNQTNPTGHGLLDIPQQVMHGALKVLSVAAEGAANYEVTRARLETALILLRALGTSQASRVPAPISSESP